MGFFVYAVGFVVSLWLVPLGSYAGWLASGCPLGVAIGFSVGLVAAMCGINASADLGHSIDRDW